MTSVFTVTDDNTFRNGLDGIKRQYGVISCTNPYTALGDLVTFPTSFGTKFLGAQQVGVGPSVSAALIATGHTATFLGDTNSLSAATMRLFNVGLSGTASAGLFVDNTVANISGLTISVEAIGY